MPNHNEIHKSILTKNGTRGWYKWLDGKSRYICSASLSEPDALRFWFENEKAIRGKIAPKAIAFPTGRTLTDIVNLYLSARELELPTGDISPAHYADCANICGMMLKLIGGTVPIDALTPHHFTPIADQIAKHAATQRRVKARIVKGVFERAIEDEWITKEVNLGKRMRDLANSEVEESDPPVWSSGECLDILAAINVKRRHYATFRPDLAESYARLYCLTLLALNGGYGMMELGQLKVGDYNSKARMMDSARGKTGVRHRVPLWPETIRALLPFLKGKRPSEAVFKTRKGHQLSRVKLNGYKASTVDGPGQTFRDLLTDIGLKREGHGFYLLKYTHRSASGGSGDESAADVLVGHRLPGMRKVYQKVTPDRLEKVATYVHDWLFTPTTA